MDISSEKLLLIERLLAIKDPKVLNQVREILENDSPIGYNHDGSSISCDELVMKIGNAEEEIKEGKFKTIEQLTQDSKAW